MLEGPPFRPQGWLGLICAVRHDAFPIVADFLFSRGLWRATMGLFLLN